MEISKVLTFDINRIPQEGSQTFRADASYVWSQISPVIDSMNVVIGEINISTEEAHKYRDESLNYSSESKNARDLALTYRDDAQTARNDAIAAKEKIDEYVIPEDATLSPDAINALVDKQKFESFLEFNF